MTHGTVQPTEDFRDILDALAQNKQTDNYNFALLKATKIELWYH